MSQLTDIQKAFTLLTGKDTLELFAKKQDKKFTLPVAEIADATLIKIAQYGSRLFNDRVNSATARNQDLDPTAITETILDKFRTGAIATTARAASPVTELERRTINILLDKLVAVGVNRKATREQLKTYTIEQIVTAHYVQIKGLPESDAVPASQRLIAACRKAAQASIDAEAFSVEL